ncbi:MAG: ArsR/SmtB family transcription factor [Acidimicrobiales bacterium]
MARTRTSTLVGSDRRATSSTAADVASPAVSVGDSLESCCISVLEAPLSEVDATELAQGFAALADPVRLRLLSLVASGEAVCSCDLEVPLAKSQPTISHHTKALADAGLIVGEKRGRWVYWSVVPERLAALRGALAQQG